MAIFKDPAEKRSLKLKCLMCEGEMETSNFGIICNVCKDKMRKTG